MVPRDPLDPVRGMSDSGKRDQRADGPEGKADRAMKRDKIAHGIGEIVVAAFVVMVVLAKILVTIFR